MVLGFKVKYHEQKYKVINVVFNQVLPWVQDAGDGVLFNGLKVAHPLLHPLGKHLLPALNPLVLLGDLGEVFLQLGDQRNNLGSRAFTHNRSMRALLGKAEQLASW